MNAVKDGMHIRIYNAFLIKESIKEIDGRFYDADDKAWVVPYSKENAGLLALLGVSLGEGLLEEEDQQQVQEPEEPILPMPIKATPYQHQIRAFNFDVHADQNEEHGHYLSGMPIVFNARANLGQYDEIISPEALANTDLRDVRFLVNHNTDMIPLARSRNNNENSTMQMTVGAEGMEIRVDLDTENNAEAKSLYSAVSRNDITSMSFMFMVDKDKWEDVESDHPTRTILAISKVFEVSAVTFPAYEQTSIQARGLSEALDSAMTSLESAKAKQREIDRRKQRIRILTEVL